MRQVIRADPTPRSPTHRRRPGRGRHCAASPARASEAEHGESSGNGKRFRRRRRSRPGRGRAEGQGRAIPCSSPAPASPCSTPICAAIRLPPARCAPAWRFRAPPPPPRSCASTPTKARCATSASPSATRSAPRRSCFRLWRDLASRPPSLDPGRIVDAAARLDLAVDPNGLAASLRACAGQGIRFRRPLSAAALAFSACPGRPSAEAEILALWRSTSSSPSGCAGRGPLPLIATKILDPTLRSPVAQPTAKAGRPSLVERRPQRAIALAAASALDLAADLSRRSETLIAVAPKLRSKPAAKIVDLLLAEDCVSPAEAARQAPMTGRAARRLFDRLVALGAAREFSGRPTFRLYGL